jgi:hypothetical protein
MRITFRIIGRSAGKISLWKRLEWIEDDIKVDINCKIFWSIYY